jgi:hypothetical protein
MAAVAAWIVPTLVLDPQPVEVAAIIERRSPLGQDLFDEVWEGGLRMNPAPRSRPRSRAGVRSLRAFGQDSAPGTQRIKPVTLTGVPPRGTDELPASRG